MDRETKALQFEIKAVKEDGTFEGLASTYGAPPDAYGDIIEKGAFAKTIKDHGGEIVVLWQHDSAEPVGKGVLEDTDDGLVIRGELELELETAKKAYIALKSKLVKGISIGFRTIRKEVRKGTRHLLEIKLYEASLVTFPANERALVTGVKSAFSERMDEEMTAGKVWRTWSVFDSVVLRTMFDRENRAADKIEQIGETIDEFKAAFLLALPDWLKRARVSSDDEGKSVLTEADADLIREEIKFLTALLPDAAESTSGGEAADTASNEPEAFHSEQLAGFMKGLKADLDTLKPQNF